MKKKLRRVFLLLFLTLLGASIGQEKASASTSLDQAVSNYNKNVGTYEEKLSDFNKIADMLKSEIETDSQAMKQSILDLTSSGELSSEDPAIVQLNDQWNTELAALYKKYDGTTLDVMDKLSSEKKIAFYNDFVITYNRFLNGDLATKHQQLLDYMSAVEGLNTTSYPFQADTSKQFLNQWDTPNFEVKDVPALPKELIAITIVPPTKEEKMAITVIKKWANANEKTQPKTIQVDLTLPDQEKPVATLTLNKEDDWKGTFKDLPANENYQVKERKVAGYTPTYSKMEKVDANNYQLTITNTLETTPPPTSEKMTIDVIKKWEGASEQEYPQKITVKLLLPGKTKDDKDILVSKLTLTAKDNWKGSFKNLSLHSNYKIVEESVAGFNANYSTLEEVSNHHYEINIVNKRIPKKPSNISKKTTPMSKSFSQRSNSAVKQYPKTGDRQTSLWIIAAGVMIIGVVFYIKRKKDE